MRYQGNFYQLMCQKRNTPEAKMLQKGNIGEQDLVGKILCEKKIVLFNLLFLFIYDKISVFSIDLQSLLAYCLYLQIDKR